MFAGIGGLALGLERAGFEAAGFVEIDEDCRHWLKGHWPDVPQWADVKEVTGDVVRGTVGSVDVMAGGFPCQPHSVAGARKGVEDERHLWPEFIRLVRELRPTWVVAENVPGIRTSAADEVISDLEESGYAVWPTVVGACDLGAPHQRRRAFFIARVADCDRSTIRDVEQRMPWGWAEGVPDEGQAFPRGDGEVDDASGAGRSATRGSSVEQGPGHPVVRGPQGDAGREALADGSSGRQRVGGSSRRKGNGRDPDGGGPVVAHGHGGGREVERLQGGDASILRGGNGSSGHQPYRCSDGPVGEPTGTGLEGQRSDSGQPQESQPGDAGVEHTAGQRQQQSMLDREAAESPEGHTVTGASWPAPPGHPQWEWEEPRLAYTSSGRPNNGTRPPSTGGPGEPETRRRTSRPEGHRGTTGDAQPSLGSPVDGVPEGLVGFSTSHRRAALKAVGNAVVPPVAEVIGRAVMALEAEIRRARE